jgi:hypothetical protein
MSAWKELLKEYDTVKKVRGDMDSITSDSAVNDDDLIDGDDDEFGMESGGWCCFTNSLSIIYL